VERSDNILVRVHAKYHAERCRSRQTSTAWNSEAGMGSKFAHYPIFIDGGKMILFTAVITALFIAEDCSNF